MFLGIALERLALQGKAAGVSALCDKQIPVRIAQVSGERV